MWMNYYLLPRPITEKSWSRRTYPKVHFSKKHPITELQILPLMSGASWREFWLISVEISSCDAGFWSQLEHWKAPTLTGFLFMATAQRLMGIVVFKAIHWEEETLISQNMRAWITCRASVDGNSVISFSFGWQHKCCSGTKFAILNDFFSLILTHFFNQNTLRTCERLS